MKALAQLEIMLEDMYDDASYRLLQAKSRVHNQEVFLRDLKNKVSTSGNPRQKASLTDKVKEEEDDLKKYREIQKARELELQAAKHKQSAQKYTKERPSYQPSL